MNPKQNKIITLTLNPSIDQIQTVDPFLPFGKNIILGSEKFLGGKGINAAFTLGKLGVDCFALGFTGSDILLDYEDKLKREGVETYFISVQGKTRENLKIVDLKSGKDTEFNQPGFQVGVQEIALMNSMVEEHLPNTDWLILSGSLPPGMPNNYYYELISLAKMKGTQTCLDTSGSPLIEGVSAQPDILRINLSEFQELVNISHDNEIELIQEIVHFQKTSVKYLVISLGSQGAIGFDGQDMLKVKIPAISPVSLTGAGDAMTAAFVHQLNQKKSFKDALLFSAAVASASVLCKEPGDFLLEDVHWHLANIQVEKMDYIM
jgi:1-phosphofructokinase